ncbi:type 1 glutamine amidotransferase [Tolumonas lignilytica]|uniref:type 1 glutamine amidotransferase n=1 Tax=Tolumonas lignilytica TaxID=1283284 RepID=UPI00046532FA|nr:type 1 glutamine amidotransferase [Tolumonas lignilytica]
MRVYVLQHVPFEELGNIQPWLEQQQAEISYCRLYFNDPLPEPADVDLLIVLGGPMSANDEAHYPWLRAEKAFLAAVIAAEKPVVGICLGAQLIASSQGARIYSNYAKEIGWFDIESVPAEGDVLPLPPRMNVFHWHGETFELPAQAILLASSEACNNQIFQLGKRVIGLQCHLETTEANARSMIMHCADELIGGRFIQDADAILSASPRHYQQLAQWMTQVLEYVVRA